MNGPHRPTHPRGRGFTLIELLVVFGIIAIISAAALPNITGWVRSSNIRSAQRQIGDALQRAKIRGITRNTQYGILFAIQNDTTYWIHQEDPRNIIDANTLGADGGGRQLINTATPAADKSSSFVLPPNIRFATNTADCPAGTFVGYAPNVASVRFDRYGVLTVPGQAGAPSPAAGSSALANRLHYVAGQDIGICLFDTRTGLRRVIRIAPGGRIRMQ